MILLDSRVGSKHLAPELEGLGAEFELTHLEFADACFTGNGPDGVVSVGVEIKNVNDLANSIQSGRLAGHQVPGLLDNYQHIWLVVEGFYRNSPSNIVEVPRGAGWQPLHLGSRPVFWTGLEGFLTTLEVQASIHVRRTRTPRETAEFLKLLHHWWGQPYDEHRALKAVHRSAPRAELARLDETTRQIRDIALTLPGIGYDRAMAVAKHFPSPAALFLTSERDWQAIDGIGRTLAKRIVAALHTERKEAA